MFGSGSWNPVQHSAGVDPSSTSISAVGGGDDSRRAPMASADPRLPLLNLSILGQGMDSLRRFLSDSVDRRAPLAGDQLQLVSAEIASTVHQTILNGAALLASFQPFPHLTAAVDPAAGRAADQIVSGSDPASSTAAAEDGDAVEEVGDIVEIDTAELLVEQVHFCEICGKGFKREANLRMHMRAHGNQFKTLEALSKPPDRDGHMPDGGGGGCGRLVRFSCPFAGCNRNRHHGRFRPLKSVACVKNHFKRSHCPKMYSCHRCSKKSFSVMADLKRHLKHCGESRWRCSCGTSFSRKDQLFRHVALFEGHLPAIGPGEEEEEEELVVGGREDIEMGGYDSVGGESFDLEFFDRLMKELEGIEGGSWTARQASNR